MILKSKIMISSKRYQNIIINLFLNQISTRLSLFNLKTEKSKERLKKSWELSVNMKNFDVFSINFNFDLLKKLILTLKNI